MKRLLLIACLGASACVTVRPPAPPVTTPAQPDRTKEFTDTCTDIYRTELQREPDSEGLIGCINQARGGKTKEDLIAWIRSSDEYIALHSFHPLPRLGIAGRSFTLNGQLVTLKGATAFPLMDRWIKGENLQPFFDAYRRANLFIVFVYTPRNVWGADAWDTPTPQQVVDFLHAMNEKGKYVELVLLTSAGDEHVQAAKAILAALAQAKPSNVIIRLGNEPEQQNGPGNPVYSTLPLKDAVEATDFIYDSGYYARGAAKWFGIVGRSYVSPHTERDDEWPRRSHDCYDQSHKPKDAPADAQNLDVPCFLGEPQKAGLMAPNDAKAYGASAVQFGAGAACHAETGKYLQLPTTAEQAACNALYDGLEAFPAGTNTGAYSRIDGVSLRTYKVGNTMTMIRPIHPGLPPEPGWSTLDGIIWRR